MATLKKSSLSDQLYQKLRNNIINLSYPLGSRLSICDLEEAFGVSSTPIREAINRLHAEGLLVMENNVGARVIDFGEKAIREAMEVGTVLYTASIRFSMTRSDNHYLGALLEKTVAAYSKAKSIETRIKGAQKFFHIFPEHAGNSRIMKLVRITQGEQRILRQLFYRYYDSTEQNISYMGEIARAVKEGNQERAVSEYEDMHDLATELIVEAFKALNDNEQGAV